MTLSIDRFDHIGALGPMTSVYCRDPDVTNQAS